MKYLPRNTLIWIVAAGLALGLLAWKFSVDYAHKQAAGEAPAAGAMAEPVIISGFRSATFGDDETAVRAAIAKDFSGGPTITKAESATEKTTLLAIRAKDVIPDSGIAEIVYILGYKSKGLIQVNLLWGTQVTPDVTDAQLGATAQILKQYFMGRGFVPSTIVHDKKMPTGAIVVFSGADAEGRLVRLMYQEALIEAAPPASAVNPQTDPKTGKPAAVAKNAKAASPAEKIAPRRVAALRLSYIVDVKNPDIFKIDKGQF
ncbi:MAG TPA: hypothetical protein VF449_10580 [Parvibaculum sp.]